MTLTDLLGNDDAQWMNNPGRNCNIPDPHLYTPKELGAFADMWFPTERGESHFAKKLCRKCPVQSACLRYAMDNPELEGIYGGTSTSGRAEMRKKSGGRAA